MPGFRNRLSSILGRAIALPSHTRGGSRMRESRPYGSVRGARDETRVPTATAAPGWTGGDWERPSARQTPKPEAGTTVWRADPWWHALPAAGDARPQTVPPAWRAEPRRATRAKERQLQKRRLDGRGD